MSLFEVLRVRGTVVLLRFLGAAALFLVLHLARIPLVLLARVLEVAMRRADAAATRAASQAPAGPINHFFHPGTREESVNVHA